MAISKKTRILLLIGVDAIFFFLEIIIGYTAHSLALVADAFHMLNDIISLCVGYWATDVAENKASSSDYTYGWARAEILGGLVNGVFLIALCVTIVLDAIQRFFEIQEVSNPRLVLIVGAVGLVFNIMGLFLFHQHDHGHDDGHSHDSADELDSAETGHAGHAHSHDANHQNGLAGKADSKTKVDQKGVSFKDDDDADETTPLVQRPSPISARKNINRRRTGSRTYDSSENIPIFPASLRQDMRNQARMEESESSSEEGWDEDGQGIPGGETNTNASPRKSTRKQSRRRSIRRAQQPETNEDGSAVDHHAHKHSQPKSSKSHGHSHDDNVRGMFLHVLGDALGNVGVMASALIIWLTDWSFRFYFDPIISLFITMIILKSAWPLVRDTARPLLQATPEDINVEDIREDINSLPGVRECHHIHVWALTRSKLIATLHVQLDFNFERKEGLQRWMDLAKEMKSCLHGHNIHNVTIQPEFCSDATHADAAHAHDHNGNASSSSSNHTVIPYAEGGQGGDIDGGTGSSTGAAAAAAQGSAATSQHHHCGHGECLLDDDCEGMACCGPPTGGAGGSGTATPKKNHAAGSGGHDHGHGGHGHSH